MTNHYTGKVYKEVTISFVNETTLLLIWPEKICPVQHAFILSIEQVIKSALANKYIDSVAAFNSLQIQFAYHDISFTELCKLIESAIDNTSVSVATSNLEKVVEIPVYYGEEAGWDLSYVARQANLTIEQVIGAHHGKAYRAYALGFTAGFCYLADIDSRLVLPRRTTPRKQVPTGAVAIAEQQTAVYPDVSPGGWHIIGQTPMSMFTITNKSLTTAISVGDKVQFIPITQQEFKDLGGTIALEAN